MQSDNLKTNQEGQNTIVEIKNEASPTRTPKV